MRMMGWDGCHVLSIMFALRTLRVGAGGSGWRACRPAKASSMPSYLFPCGRPKINVLQMVCIELCWYLFVLASLSVCLSAISRAWVLDRCASFPFSFAFCSSRSTRARPTLSPPGPTSPISPRTYIVHAHPRLLGRSIRWKRVTKSLP